jgi:type I restriction enzyme S subunit
MADNKSGGVTPRLRFPQFRTSGEWITKELGELARPVTERVGSSSCVPYTVTSGVGLVSQQEKLGRTIAGKSIKNYVVLQRDDFAFNKSATKAYPQGFIARYVGGERAAVPNSIFTCFRIDQEAADPAYLEHLFAFNQHGRWLRKYISVGARAHGSLNVSDDDLMKVPVPLPPNATSKEEQRCIAKGLTSLDEVIAAQAQKVEALNAHKQGLMQQLFPRAGETVPRLRFSEFLGRSPWHSRKIASLLRKVVEPASVHPELTYREIGVRSHGKGVFHKDDVSGKSLGNKRVFHVVQNALVVNIVFAWEQAVATTSAAENGMIASHRFPMFVPKAGECDIRYVKEFFLTKWGKHLLGAASPGGAGRNRTLGQTEFEKLDIVLPESVEEQSRIADCLLSIETEINVASERLAALRRHRQGLMQQLFPRSEVDA